MSSELGLTDVEALQRTRSLTEFGISTHEGVVQRASSNRKQLRGLVSNGPWNIAAIREVIDFPCVPSTEWQKGLVGIFDAEGSYSGAAVRISNTDHAILGLITSSLRHLGFSFTQRTAERDDSRMPAALESGRRAGMTSFGESLATLVREGTVHPSHAFRKAPNREQFLAILRREGVHRRSPNAWPDELLNGSLRSPAAPPRRHRFRPPQRAGAPRPIRSGGPPVPPSSSRSAPGRFSRRLASALVAEGHRFKVFTPADSIRLASESSAEDFIELSLDSTVDPPAVMGRISRGRGRRIVTSERAVKDDVSIDSCHEEDVLAFLMAELTPFLER